MIVALHPMGGDPAYFLQLLRRYRRRARLILPYGHPYGGMYIWYESVRDVARKVLLDALTALGSHRDAIVLVGAQAIFARICCNRALLDVGGELLSWS